VITRQLMQKARMLETERRHILQGSVSTGAKEDDSSTGHIWVAGFHRVTARSHRVTARSRLARVLNL
jgi:hypothetical protein